MHLFCSSHFLLGLIFPHRTRNQPTNNNNINITRTEYAMTFTVRPARRDEVEAMMSMQMAMAMESEGHQLNEVQLRRGLTLPFDQPAVTGAVLYVVEGESGQLAGMFMTTVEWSDWRGAAILWIQSVYVLPDYRRQGAFRAMYAHVKAMVEASDDYEGIRLYVENNNSAAMAAYEEMGMKTEHYNMMGWLKGGPHGPS